MSRPAITCEHLSKRYILGTGTRQGPPGLRETVAQKLRTLRGALRNGDGVEKPSTQQEFWALKDVSFEIGRGELVGIVGRNGAGKSTLLKVLSRIVEPTKGSVRLRGRVASLLEVGTGFHAELTGRENIYLNGAILGMSRAEIARKFDEIVAFSEIEAFLDTPVKRYSSGMYVRLAFAVAAHLEPEILIVDEVLAVGDHSFQKKCLGKMQDVATGDGRTILFVSHNVGALAQLCRRGILLERGAVTMDGPIRDVIGGYLNAISDNRSAHMEFPPDPSKLCQFLSAAVVREDGTPSSEFGCDESFLIRMELEVRRYIPNMKVFIDLYTIDGIRLWTSDIRDAGPSMVERLGVGVHTFEVPVPPGLLGARTYLLNVACEYLTCDPIDVQNACCEFTLRDTSSPVPERPGLLFVLVPWKHQHDPQLSGVVRPEPAAAV
jgi:lipopolysaccharide transport system ATP-binding protein